MNSEDWLKEFEEFSQVDPVAPPDQLSQNIFSRIQHDLNPPFATLLFKLALIQLVVGAFTLLFCPQFDFGPLQGSGLAGLLFHYFGLPGCRLGCGMTFMGAGLLVASLILSAEEVRAFRKNMMLLMSMLVLFSLGVFVCIVGMHVLEWMTMIWVIGATVGGLGSFEFGLMIRRQVRT